MNDRPSPVAPAVTEAAAQWHALQREGDLDAAGQARFMDWLVADPAHLREYLLIGRLAGELPREEATQEKVLRLMAGVAAA